MNLKSRRLVFILLFIGVGFIYVARLFYMQLIDDKWIERAAEVARTKIIIKPPRGIMYDRNGNIVVGNKTYYNLMFVESHIKELDTLAFAKLVGMTKQEVKNRFIEIRKSLDRKTRSKFTGNDTIVNDYRSYLPYPFLKELTAKEMAEIAIYLSRFNGFYEQPISQRNYPDSCGANLFGYINEVNWQEINNDPDFYSIGDMIGRTGLERYYEKVLRGKKGKKIILKSARGEVLDNYAGGKLDSMAKQGPPLHLGLDIELQKYGQLLMKNKIGSIVAIEPSSGEVLAMVTAPTYDPNLLVGTKKIAKNYTQLYKDSLEPLFPRARAASYPPGSTFKVLQALIGLQEEVITTETGFPCIKSLVGCHNHPYAGSVAEAIKYSCNPYFYQEVRRIIRQHKAESIFKDAAIGLEAWDNYVYSFGLEEKPGIDLYGATKGLIPTVDFYNRWYGEYRWAFSTIQSISIGQGEVQLTPLQLANFTAIVANGGYYYEPHLVSSIGNKGPLERFTIRKKTMVDTTHFTPVREGMRMVVNAPGGTARRARLQDIIVAGKTGTAQNSHGEDHSLFIAFAPYDNPKIAIAVMVENAGYGGVWAAPIASLMIQKYLKREIPEEYHYREQRILNANFIDNE